MEYSIDWHYLYVVPPLVIRYRENTVLMSCGYDKRREMKWGQREDRKMGRKYKDNVAWRSIKIHTEIHPTAKKILIDQRNVWMQQQHVSWAITITDALIFQKYRSHFKIPGTTSVIWNNFCAHNQQNLGPTVQNFIAQATQRQEFVHPCCYWWWW